MSLSTKRADVAAAMSTLAGVAGYERTPTTPRPGDAWPMWGPAERAEEGYVLVHTWRVIIVLPQDKVKADQWVDDRLYEVWDVLEPHGYITAAAPVTLPSDGGDLLALQMTMRSE